MGFEYQQGAGGTHGVAKSDLSPGWARHGLLSELPQAAPLPWQAVENRMIADIPRCSPSHKNIIGAAARRKNRDYGGEFHSLFYYLALLAWDQVVTYEIQPHRNHTRATCSSPFRRRDGVQDHSQSQSTAAVQAKWTRILPFFSSWRAWAPRSSTAVKSVDAMGL